MNRLAQAVLAMVAVVLLSGFTSVGHYTPTDDVETRLAKAEQQIASLVQKEADRDANDQVILLNDASAHLIDRGIISLDATSKAVGVNGVYRFKNDAGFYDSVEVWHSLTARKGETIYLFTLGQDDGEEHVAYYTCLTNSLYCYGADPKILPVIVPQHETQAVKPI